MGLFGRMFGSEDSRGSHVESSRKEAQSFSPPLPDQPPRGASVSHGATEAAVTAFSPSRVMALLDADGDRYDVDEDGDLIGRWDDEIYQFIFYVNDKRATLQIAGRTLTPIPAEHEDELDLLIEDWNRDHFWPKALTRELSDGLYPFGEVAIDYTEGVTDAQLRQHIVCAMGTTSQLMRTVRDRFGIAPLDD